MNTSTYSSWNVTLGTVKSRLATVGGAAALREDMDTPCRPVWMQEVNLWLDRARAALGEDTRAKTWADALATDELAASESSAALAITRGLLAPARE